MRPPTRSVLVANGWMSVVVVLMSYLILADAVVVKTEVGDVMGKMINVTLRDGRRYTLARFYGIPYAEPPVDNLRFAKPVPKAKFREPFKAFHYGPACPQVNPKGNVMSEDCLSLNIFVPESSLTNHSQEQSLTPVLFWIHGGSFVNGEGRRSPVQNLAAFGGIIIVTINFRLGALGFLSTGDKQAPGNYGLWDQRLALQWVKANIRSFGGDPERITVMGASSGGVCVTFHAMYPPNNGLFRRIFVASGSPLGASTYYQKQREYTEALAQQLGCKSVSSSQLLSCMRTKKFEDIVNAQLEPTGPFDLPWAPIVDGDYIQDDPVRVLTWPPSGADLPLLRSVDAMFGTCSADGSLDVRTWIKKMADKANVDLKQGVTPGLFDMIVKEMLSTYNQQWVQLMKSAVLYEYTPWNDPHDLFAMGTSTIDLTTDKHFFLPNVILSRNHAQHNSRAHTFLFYFNEPKNETKMYPWIPGTTHGRFNAYALGMPEERWKPVVDLDLESHRKLWELSTTVMTYWSNFVKSGDPNHPATVDEIWRPFDTTNESYLYLDADVISARKRCKAKRTEFWLNFLPEISEEVGDEEVGKERK